MENPANNLELAFNEKEKPGSLRKCSAWSPGMSVHNSPSLSVLPRGLGGFTSPTEDPEV